MQTKLFFKTFLSSQSQIWKNQAMRQSEDLTQSSVKRHCDGSLKYTANWVFFHWNSVSFSVWKKLVLGVTRFIQWRRVTSLPLYLICSKNTKDVRHVERSLWRRTMTWLESLNKPWITALSFSALAPFSLAMISGNSLSETLLVVFVLFCFFCSLLFSKLWSCHRVLDLRVGGVQCVGLPKATTKAVPCLRRGYTCPSPLENQVLGDWSWGRWQF